MKAFITGISGQDGSYLAELLLFKGYEVHGMIRRISQPNLSNLKNCLSDITLHTGDMTDGTSIFRIIEKIKPNEIYNLAAMSQVRDSYDHPETTQDINANGLLRIMEAVKALNLDCKIYQACSSEMFGKVQETPQTETTKFYPRSPYGASKVAAYEMARIWREAYGMKVYCGILFNHESPRRGEAFLSRKVCKAVAEIALGQRDKLILGNLDAKRDWGYAKEYVEWIHRIMQHTTPDDFVIATGETHSVKEWVELAFSYVGIKNWEDYVEFDKSLTRPAEVDLLMGDASKSKKILGYEPKTKFKDLVAIMVDAEMQKLNPVHEDNRRKLTSFPEAKMLEIKEDCILGKHYHKVKTEKFILCQGNALLTVNDQNPIEMEIGKIYTISPGQIHTFKIKKGSILIGLNSKQFDSTDDYKE